MRNLLKRWWILTCICLLSGAIALPLWLSARRPNSELLVQATMAPAKPKDSGVTKQRSKEEELEAEFAQFEAKRQACEKKWEEQKRKIEEIEKPHLRKWQEEMRDAEKTKRGFGLPVYPVL